MDWFSFFLFPKNIKFFNLETLVMLHQGPHRVVINLLQLASTQCGFGPVYPHRAIVNLLQLASTQCGFGPVCAPQRYYQTSTCLRVFEVCQVIFAILLFHVCFYFCLLQFIDLCIWLGSDYCDSVKGESSVGSDDP